MRPVNASSSWAAAPPLLISPRLRRTGSYERRGRPNRVVDRADARRRLAERAADEAEQTAAARARLATGRPIRLVEIGELDSDAFRLFLQLLGDALAARRPDEREVRTTTADGSLSVRLIAVAHAPMVEIRTETGILRGADHVIEIIDLVGDTASADAEPLDAGSRLVGVSHALDTALDEARRREQQRAVRALLRRPLLLEGADEFRLVRRYATELREWFDANTGWRLHVDTEVARLVKRPATLDNPSHPAREPRSHVAFGRRRYVLDLPGAGGARACRRADHARPPGGGGDRWRPATSASPRRGSRFTLSGREERGDLVAVVRLLLEVGVLSRVAGEEEAFVRAAGDALYDIERRVLAALIASPRGASTVDAGDFESRLEQLSGEPMPVAEDLRVRSIRHRVTRRMLDDPVVYYEELDEGELAYLTSQRPAMIRRVEERTGLLAEVRAEGLAMVDPNDELTDVRMPEVGTDGHVALLITEHLSSRMDEQSGRHAPNRSFTASSGGSPTSIAATGVTARANRGPRSRSSPRPWSGSRRCA